MSMRKAAPGAVRATLAALLVLSSAGDLAAATKSKAKKTAPAKAARDYARSTAVLHTERGDVTVRFFFDRAPNHAMEKSSVVKAAAGEIDEVPHVIDRKSVV